MTYEQKLAALNALHSEFINSRCCVLCMREPGSWYASTDVEVGDGCVLTGLKGEGSTPEEAVNDLWREATELTSEQRIVIDAYKPTHRAVKWNGFMWAAFDEKRAR